VISADFHPQEILVFAQFLLAFSNCSREHLSRRESVEGSFPDRRRQDLSGDFANFTGKRPSGRCRAVRGPAPAGGGRAILRDCRSSGGRPLLRPPPGVSPAARRVLRDVRAQRGTGTLLREWLPPWPPEALPRKHRRLAAALGTVAKHALRRAQPFPSGKCRAAQDEDSARGALSDRRRGSLPPCFRVREPARLQRRQECPARTHASVVSTTLLTPRLFSTPEHRLQQHIVAQVEKMGACCRARRRAGTGAVYARARTDYSLAVRSPSRPRRPAIDRLPP
jgi:hypothetical protein